MHSFCAVRETAEANVQSYLTSHRYQWP